MNLQTKTSSVVIVGSGASALYCALNLRDDIDVTIITEKTCTDCNSYLAQGGIATARSNEDIPAHIADTLKAGQYKNSVKAVEVLVNESRENIDNLLKLGVDLDKENNHLLYTKEAAHSINRIVHHKDTTGKAVVDGLLAKVKTKKNITIIENASLVDLIVENNQCHGIIYYKDNDYIKLTAKDVVLATGGIGGLFKHSTNFRHIKGIGLYLSIKHNIKLHDTEYIQFHPTAFYDENNDGRCFLISESLRGEGAIITNLDGERFVNELLPRDVVTKEILKEMHRTNSSHVLLDISHKDSEYIKNRFPSIYSNCLEKGYDLCAGPIPIAPAQHYFMGGIEVNLNSKSSMDNLYVVGEASCTGVHGANRLASNSLLEALVFSRRAAKEINTFINDTTLTTVDYKDILDINTTKKDSLATLIKYFSSKGDFIKNELVNY